MSRIVGREPWFAALKLDLHELAEHPTHYGQEEHGETHADALQAIIALARLGAAARAVDAYLSDNGPPFRFDRKHISDEAQTALLILHDELNTLDAIAAEVVTAEAANSHSQADA